MTEFPPPELPSPGLPGEAGRPPSGIRPVHRRLPADAQAQQPAAAETARSGRDFAAWRRSRSGAGNRRPRLLLLLAAGAALIVSGCSREPSAAPAKPSKKKPDAIAQAARERQALNALAEKLRSLPAETVQSGPSAAARAGALLAHLKPVPAGELPETIRGPWGTMLAVLEEVSTAGEPLPGPLRQRGTEAAATLNAALRSAGVTDCGF